MKKLHIVLLLLLATFATQSAMAWGKWGHRISAYIAEQHLTEKANSECRRYLKHSLPYFASWQDYWRHCDGYKESTYWHMNYLDAKYKKVVGYKKNVSRDAVTQIDRIVKEMEGGKYKNLPDSIVADNVKFLIHMVADMHCPSHVGYAKEKGFKNNSLYIKGKKVSRHTFWDGSPMYLHPKWRIERFVKAYDTYSPKEIKKIQKGTPLKWGRQNAVKVEPTFTMWERHANFNKFSKEQRRAIEDLTHEQLAYGGYRLAAILNKIFK